MKRTSSRKLSLFLALAIFFTSFLGISTSAMCSHSSCKDYWSWSEYVSYNQTQHRIKHYYNRVCNDCGAYVKVVNNFEWAKHEMYDNECECGYKYVCKHNNCKDYWIRSEYVSYNQTQHKIKHYFDRTCQDCGEFIKEVNNYKWAKHEMYDNECECGYKYVCKHNTYNDTLVNTEYTGKTNKSQHQVKKISDRVCAKCGEFIKSVSSTKWEKHSFINGKCECGYGDVTNAVVDIISYKITLDKNNKYVTIDVQGSKDVAKIDIYLRGSTVIDSLDVNSSSAEAKFAIPYSDEEKEYIVGIVAFGKDMSNSKTIKEKIVANNSKTWWDRLNQATDNLSYMTLGVVNGVINAGIIQPVQMTTEFLDWGLNIFDKEMYEHNKTQRNNLYKELENIIDDSLSNEQAYYYYWGTFGGGTSDLVVGGIYAFKGLTGVINSISTTKGGVKILQSTLDSGDEAVAIFSNDASDVLMLTSKVDDTVYSTIDAGLNFTDTALQHFKNPNRFVPIQMIIDTVKTGTPLPDPQGYATLTMYYKQVLIGNKLYNLEVLYESVTNTIYHFQYTRDAIGPLAQILK